MKATPRLIRIKDILKKEEFVELETLARKLGASASTVRRDLTSLEKEGVLKRVHGGAVVAQPHSDQPDYAQLSSLSASEKQRIAMAAVGLLRDGQTVILDGGSTVAEVARQINASGLTLHIITNSIPIAQVFFNSTTVEVTLTGGFLYPRMGVLLGHFCEQMLSTAHADVAVMGIGGITEQGLSNTNALVVGSERKMIEVSRRVIIVADHTKFGRDAVVPLVPLEKIQSVVSDTGLDPSYRKMLEAKGIEVVIAE